MAATMKGAISFGLLHVPVSLHTATQDNDIPSTSFAGRTAAG